MIVGEKIGGSDLDIVLQSNYGEGGEGLMKGGMGRPRMEVEMGVVPKVQNLEGYAGNCNTKSNYKF